MAKWLAISFTFCIWRRPQAGLVVTRHASLRQHRCRSAPKKKHTGTPNMWSFIHHGQQTCMSKVRDRWMCVVRQNSSRWVSGEAKTTNALRWRKFFVTRDAAYEAIIKTILSRFWAVIRAGKTGRSNGGGCNPGVERLKCETLPTK